MTTNRIDDIVQIDATISAGAGPGPDFGRVMLVTLDTSTSVENRVQVFDDIAAVAKEFPSGNVYESALAYFRQEPTPAPLKVGKWFKTAQASRVNGGAHATLATLVALTDTWTLAINGTTVTPATLAGDVSLAEVATGVQAAIRATAGSPLGFTNATVSYIVASARFELTLGDNVIFVAPPSGTLAVNMGWSDGTVINGNDAETVAEGGAAIQGEGQFYWTCLSDDISDVADILAWANYTIAANKKYFFWDESNAGTLVTNESTGTAAQLSDLGAGHVAVIYGSEDDGKAIEIASQFSTVDFNGFNTLLAIHGKTLIGSRGDNLTSQQITELERKKINYYQRYGTIGYVVNGWSVDGQFIDVNYSLDWMVNAMEIQVFDALRSARRTPQTPAGVATIRAALRSVCEQGFQNGMIDGGQFSPVVTGNIRRTSGNTGYDGATAKGYFIYIGSIAAQSQVARRARKAPPITVWLKSSGNIQFARINLLLEP